MESGDKGKTNPKSDVSSFFSLSLVIWINYYDKIDTIVIVLNNSFANVMQNNLWELETVRKEQAGNIKRAFVECNYKVFNSRGTQSPSIVFSQLFCNALLLVAALIKTQSSEIMHGVASSIQKHLSNVK